MTSYRWKSEFWSLSMPHLAPVSICRHIDASLYCMTVVKMVQIVGILNVTPDSYFDGGCFISIDAAVARAGEMLAKGADWIEIGGESTGPGSSDVTLEEELHRVTPVIEAIRAAHPEANISVDTYKAPVARMAVRAGASMINDVTAGRMDPEIFTVAKETGSRLVLMYAKDSGPRTTRTAAHYKDVVSTVKEFVRERRDAALAADIPKRHIILDPGLGHFISSEARYSYEIIARLGEFAALECPIFLSPSRKSFLEGSGHLKTTDRLLGTVAASAIAVLHGAEYIRTHDVTEVRRACEVAAAIRSMKNQ